jgi:predicted RNase H-like HicB family nuclease
MTKTFTASVWQEGEWYIAQCLEVDIASQGEDEASALRNLEEALELYYEEPRATIAPQVFQIQVKLNVP